jgi:KipI family sensor histidine kinase inhibitor
MRRLPVGDDALLVELDDAATVVETYRQIQVLVEAGTVPRPRDLVPAARTVLVDGVTPDPWWDAFTSAASSGQTWTHAADPAETRDIVTISMRYDGEDLDEVARQWDCDLDEVVRRHQEAEFTVAFCGFAPGFAYCTSAPSLPEVTRRDDPRTQVPTGSVGLAGPYCGIYPVAMPGGWQLIGSTDEVMFDVDRAEPARLRPGDRVRFRVRDVSPERET